MLLDPIRKVALAQVAGGDSEDDGHRLLVCRHQLGIISLEEGDHDDERDALIAVDVRVIPSQAKRVGRRQLGEARVATVMPAVSWLRQRRLERVFVAYAVGAAVLADLSKVSLVDYQAPEPMRLGPCQRASSRSADL